MQVNDLPGVATEVLAVLDVSWLSRRAVSAWMWRRIMKLHTKVYMELWAMADLSYSVHHLCFLEKTCCRCMVVCVCVCLCVYP